MQYTNKSNREAPSTNTQGPRFLNSEGTYQSTMQLGYWNDMVSIRIHPALDPKDQTESRKFDYDTSISTALPLDKVMYLYESVASMRSTLEDHIYRTNRNAAEPNEEDRVPVEPLKDTFVGVPVGNNNSLFGVGYAVREGQTPLVFAAIYKDLNENTKRPESYLYYEFKDFTGITDYNPETGEFDLDREDIYAEFALFETFLITAVRTLMHATSHSTRTVDRAYRERLNERLDEIAGKLGIEKKSYGGKNSGGFNSSRRGVFGGGGSSTPATTNDTADADLGADAKFSTGSMADLERFSQ